MYSKAFEKTGAPRKITTFGAPSFSYRLLAIILAAGQLAGPPVFLYRRSQFFYQATKSRVRNATKRGRFASRTLHFPKVLIVFCKTEGPKREKRARFARRNLHFLRFYKVF